MPADDRRLAEARQELARREVKLQQEIADLNAELEQTNRGLIALLAELESTRQAEARLAAIVRSCDDAMFAMTPQGVIQTWNPGAERLFGHSTDDIVGRAAATLVPDGSREEFAATFERIRSGGRAGPYDTRLRRADGSLVDVAVTVSAIRDPGGALTGFSAVVRDLTERLRMEAELATARADQEDMADRDRIARDLHDMVIQRVFGAGLALQATAGLAREPQVAARLQAVIGELDATIEELRTAIFDLQRLPEEAPTLRARLSALASGAAEALGFSPAVVFEGPINTAVPDDVAVHLLAVVREALSNITRHAQASAAQMTVGAGSDLVLQVTDNGRGFAETTRTSGLGNLRDRALALGGTFEITSRPGAGTRLEWRVPLP